MDLATGASVHDSQAMSPITGDGSSVTKSPLHSSEASFPIIAIAVIGILATAFLLVSYYIFVIKCCLNWHRIDLLRRFSLSRRRRDDPLMMYSPGIETRGLDEAVIQSIPVLKFKKGGNKNIGESFCECAVCLNEFQEDEKLRKIPNCSHLFHIDCIDVWLQNNDNCPLCRNSISSTTRFHPDQIVAPSTSPEDPTPYNENVIGRHEEFVVIELGGMQDPADGPMLLGRQERRQERFSPRAVSLHSISPSPRKMEQSSVQKKGRKLHKGSSMGDECINTRGKDDQFSIQPIRRSISMDSSTDRQLLLAIQEIVRQNGQVSEVSPIEEPSSRVRRSFFSFGHGRTSRSSVLPVYSEP